MNAFETTKKQLIEKPCKWLVTGAAGFIGSHLVEELLKLGQFVVGLDNFSTSTRTNLDDIKNTVDSDTWGRFTFIEGDITSKPTVEKAVQGINYVLHQAALGSVPRSIAEPENSHNVNVNGFINMLVASRDAGVKRFVYASSSSVYGDSERSPKREEDLGEALSPYAVTKYVNELYAKVFSRNYDIETVGLRYFNVFGPRQSPEGQYAAVIPRWMDALASGKRCVIYGDGSTSRDFCYIKNVVQANILAACSPIENRDVFNIAAERQTSLLQLFEMIQKSMAEKVPSIRELSEPQFEPFRKGDIMHSLANIDHAKEILGYEPTYDVQQGVAELVAWQVARVQNR